LLISKYIPDIPYFLENVTGPPGAMKSHHLKFDKRLVNPGITELHHPSAFVGKKDIQQIDNPSFKGFALPSTR
jgi:hypothetical protein